MDYRVIPIAEEHIAGFRSAVDRVAREHRYLAFLEAPPIESAREFVLGNLRDGHPHFVALAGDEVVGWCNITPKPRPAFSRTGVLGMGIVDGYRGHGIGVALIRAALDAGRQRGLHRVELHVRENNQRAIALYEKVGFVREGYLLDDVFVDGAYESSYLMALLF